MRERDVRSGTAVGGRESLGDAFVRYAALMKATARARLVVSLAATILGCGLSLGGQAVLEGADGDSSPGGEGGDVTAGSSDASGSGSSSGANPLDEGPAADDAAAEGTILDGGSPAFDAAVSVMDADAAGTAPEGGPSHGMMGCPPRLRRGRVRSHLQRVLHVPGLLCPLPHELLPRPHRVRGRGLQRLLRSPHLRRRKQLRAWIRFSGGSRSQRRDVSSWIFRVTAEMAFFEMAVPR